MKPLSQTDMAEATRLTVEGRLDEAVALLRGAIRATAAPATSSEAEPKRPPAPPRRTPEFVDLVPPSAATGDCWTLPPRAQTERGSKENQASRTDNDVGDQADKELPRTYSRTPRAGTRALILPEGARFEQRAFTNHAGTRRYKLYIPSNFTGETAPLVMMLHGCTQSPDDFAAGTRMNLLAEEFGFLVAYPAQPKSANLSKCWNWFRPGDQCRGQGEPALMAGMARQIATDFPIVRSQIYVRRLVGRWRSGGDPGRDLPRHLRGGWRSFGAGLRCCYGCPIGLPRNAAGRLRRQTISACRFFTTYPNDRVSWGQRHHGQSGQRRSRDSAGQGERRPQTFYKKRLLARRRQIYVYR